MDAEQTKPKADADAAAATPADDFGLTTEPEIGRYDPFGPLFEPTFGMDDF